MELTLKFDDNLKLAESRILTETDREQKQIQNILQKVLTIVDENQQSAQWKIIVNLIANAKAGTGAQHNQVLKQYREV